MTPPVRALAAILALTAAAPALGCGESARSTAHVTSRPASTLPSHLTLTGEGVTGARIGTAAVHAQGLAAHALGPPQDKYFSGCTIEGANARYDEMTWSWGALTLVFENRATTAKVVPGRFLAWTVSSIGRVPPKVSLPHGLTRTSSLADVRSVTALTRAGSGLPGEYELTGTDGVDYTFATATRRLQTISLHGPSCE